MRFVLKLDNGSYVGDVHTHYSEVSFTMVSFEKSFVFDDMEHVKHFIDLHGGKDKIQYYDVNLRKVYTFKVEDIIPVQLHAVDRM